MASKLPEILSHIKPSKIETEETFFKVKNFIAELDASLRKNKISAKTLLGGSFAKDTWLKGDYDVDLFVKFPVSYKGKDISSLLLKALKQWNPRQLHGSRDYFQIQDGIHYEIIPILEMDGKTAENVTDYSYMHVELVKKQPLKIKDDIRLFKQLLKANRIYGAESYINGFSGHVVDLLVIYYKGFLPLMRAVRLWKAKKVIDIKNFHKGKALFVLNASKTQGPLVLIDNIQPERNAAAAVGEYAFNKLVSIALKFNANNMSLFEIQPVDFSFLAKKGNLIKLHGSHTEGTTDVAGTKLLKVHEKIVSSLSDFGVIKSGWDFDAHTHQAVFWYVLKNTKLPATYEAKGPPLSRKDAVIGFKKAHKKTFVKSGYVWCVRQRDIVDAKTMINNVIKLNSDRIENTRIE